MADIDKQKEWIGFLKTSFFFILASIFGLISFEFLHFNNLANLSLVSMHVC